MNPIIGMVRYSVDAAFAKDHPDKIYNLWENPYFEERLAMFKGITLKSFEQQTNSHFVLLVYHSNAMPEEKKQIFIELEKIYPFMRNIFISGAKMLVPVDLLQKRMFTFRIDNDDGVPANFIDRLMEIYQRNDGCYDNVAFTIPRIRKIARIDEHRYQTDCSIFPSNAIGLAYLSVDGENIMNCGNHRLVPYHYRTLFLEGIGGLQVIHGTNVANGFKKVYDKKSELQIFEEEQMIDVLHSEGYAAVDLKSIPILANPY